MDIFGQIRRNQPDYSTLKDKCIVRVHDTEQMDVSVIIPVHGRIQYNAAITRHFREAITACGRKISLTIVEHDHHASHNGVCADWVNYIFIPMEGGIFNKSLAHNIAALYGPPSKYLHFHDLDIIVPPNYYLLIFDNLRSHDALQAFSRRRLFQADEHITGKILTAKEPFYNVVPWSSRHVKENESGASGGSIFVKRDLFMRAGGFDPELYSEYSIEDQQFFDKLNFLGSFGFCDDPPINLLHLWHPISFNRTTKQSDWDAYKAWKELDNAEKKRLCKFKQEHLLKHESGLYGDFKRYLHIFKDENFDPYVNRIQDHFVFEWMSSKVDKLLQWIIDDYVQSNWELWDEVLMRLTERIVVPSHHQGNDRQMARDWKAWYEQIYLTQ